MFLFVSGASRSGKSEWAERAVLALAGEGTRVYLATALAEDPEMRRRVARHRAARAGRGFVTVERPRDLEGAFDAIPPGTAVLLECLPNWAANEMFRDGVIREPDEVREEVLRVGMGLAAWCHHLVVVSDDIFSDGAAHDPATAAYVRLLGELHVLLAARADGAVECAGGLARWAKGSGLI